MAGSCPHPLAQRNSVVSRSRWSSSPPISQARRSSLRPCNRQFASHKPFFVACREYDTISGRDGQVSASSPLVIIGLAHMISGGHPVGISWPCRSVSEPDPIAVDQVRTKGRRTALHFALRTSSRISRCGSASTLAERKSRPSAWADDGQERGRHRISTPVGDYSATVAAIARLVADVERETGPARGIGIGIPGTISPATGLIKNANSTWLIGRPFDADLICSNSDLI